MSRLVPMSDLAADDLLLDRLAAREHAGSEPVAGLLAALADQADTPLRSRAGRRRGHRHRYLGPFAALVVAASGAGVAAAVTLPHHAPDPTEKARVVRQMDAAARSDAPSALLARLGLPRTTGATDAQGLVMARRDDGVIVLVPAAAVAVQRAQSDAAGTFAATAWAAARAAAKGHGQGGQGSAGQSATAAGASGDRNGSGTTAASGDNGNANGQGGNGSTGAGQGGDQQGSGTSGAPAGGHTGASQGSISAKKPATGGQGNGGKGSAPATSSTSSLNNTISGVVQQPTPLPSATATPNAATTP